MPVKQLTLKPPTENSRGLRLGNLVQIRDVIAEELEGGVAGKKTAKQALDDAVTRGNALLRSSRPPTSRASSAASEAAPRLDGRAVSFGRPGLSMNSASSFATGCALRCCWRRNSAVTLVFFFWPAGQAMLQSVDRGGRVRLATPFCRVGQFRRAVRRPRLLASVRVTAVLQLHGGRLRAGASAAARGDGRPGRARRRLL